MNSVVGAAPITLTPAPDSSAMLPAPPCFTPFPKHESIKAQWWQLPRAETHLVSMIMTPFQVLLCANSHKVNVWAGSHIRHGAARKVHPCLVNDTAAATGSPQDFATHTLKPLQKAILHTI